MTSSNANYLPKVPSPDAINIWVWGLNFRYMNFWRTHSNYSTYLLCSQGRLKSKGHFRIEKKIQLRAQMIWRRGILLLLLPCNWSVEKTVQMKGTTTQEADFPSLGGTVGDGIVEAFRRILGAEDGVREKEPLQLASLCVANRARLRTALHDALSKHNWEAFAGGSAWKNEPDSTQYMRFLQVSRDPSKGDWVTRRNRPNDEANFSNGWPHRALKAHWDQSLAWSTSHWLVQAAHKRWTPERSYKLPPILKPAAVTISCLPHLAWNKDVLSGARGVSSNSEGQTCRERGRESGTGPGSNKLLSQSHPLPL